MKNIEERKISFIGGGIIAEVFIKRLIESGFVFQKNIMVSDIKSERLDFLKEKYCVQVTGNNSEAAAFGDFVFLAVPPSQVKVVLSENCKELRKNQILISLAAAIPLWLIDSVLCKEIGIVRVIPNTPSQVGKGVNPYCLGKYITEEQIKDVEKLLEVFGDAVSVDESKMNIATAITAVGPTYWFPAVKALLDFAKIKGFDKELGYKLVVETMKGTAELILNTMKDPEELKLMIATRTIDEEKVKNLFYEAVNKACKIVEASEKKLTE